jgi:hypothetical protein
MNLIGICGRAGAGKDTAADVLVKDFGYVKVALADPMKRACAEWFGWDEQTLWGPSEKRNEPDKRFNRWSVEQKCNVVQFLTPREALQTLGTEWGRACYPDVWVDIAIRTAKKLLDNQTLSQIDRREGQWMYNPQEGAYWLYFNVATLPQHRGVCISDVRFPNEVAAIKAAGGRIWKIVRGITLAIGESTSDPAFASWRAHQSEAHVDDIDADLAIANVGSLETFQQMIRDLAAR